MNNLELVSGVLNRGLVKFLKGLDSRIYCVSSQMMLRYCIPNYDTPAEFLSVLAQRLGKFKKGGTPDINKAARTVLRDWNK